MRLNLYEKLENKLMLIVITVAVLLGLLATASLSEFRNSTDVL